MNDNQTRELVQAGIDAAQRLKRKPVPDEVMRQYSSLDHLIWDVEFIGGDHFELAAVLRQFADDVEDAGTKIQAEYESAV